MDSAADAGRRRGAAETFVCAYPQVVRDGFIHFDETEAEVQPFPDLAFPLALGLDAGAVPEFSTALVPTGSGREPRNAGSSDRLLAYDPGAGLRSEHDLKPR